MRELTSPDQRFYRCAGSLGWAFPASLDIKCALPDRSVVCFNGDGGFFYHLTELETAARFNIATVIVVNNNLSLNQEQRLFDAAYGGKQRGRAHEMWVFKEVDIASVAREMGCVGIRVEHPRDIKPAIQEALDSGRPALVDVVTDIDALHERAWG
jgi:acetolactate synthase-1/2/3 large subunit